jgi:hypothetical protein
LLHHADYNFVVRDNETYSLELLQRKYILHFERSVQAGCGVIAQFQTQWLGKWVAARLCQLHSGIQ